MQTQIVYEDEAVLVIRKPAGLATESAGIGRKDVVSELKNYVAKKNPGKMPYLGIVHRLDQPVEGLLVFAKTKKAAENLTAQLGKGTLKKEYLAVVCGKVPENTGRLVDYLAKEKGMAVVKNAADAKTEKDVDAQTEKDVDAQTEKAAGPQAKKAVLTYTKKAETEKFTLLAVQIETGRFHQIRAQLSHAGFPILGDEKYGSEESKELSREKKIRFTALCAASLSFRHPVTGKFIAFTQAPQNPAFADFVIE
ncbi:MAG: RluA family pseudouridine synthase [Lachnospiraceae bacterium]|nr:RluA family pseudouridine synthase [Lachnospiraceae bacterium]